MTDQPAEASLFIGLGNMGRPMAVNYAAGRDLFVYDVNGRAAANAAAAAAATILPDLRNIPPRVRTVIVMLPNSRTVEQVMRHEPGLLSCLSPGCLVIDMGSSEPASTAALADEAAAVGVDYVDAPVSGGVANAASGELAIIVGGRGDAVARAQPHLQSLGRSLVHVGPPGSGHAAKALNNLLSATNLVAAAEILTVAASLGITPATMLKVINGSTGRSQASEVKYPRHILPGTFDSGFAMDLMLKDLATAVGLINAARVKAPVVMTARAIAQEARQVLNAPVPDHTELVRYYEKHSGIPLRANDPAG